MKYKNKKGLTLIEVLVSVVITVLVMVYGVNLFVASWKLSVESAEYNYVLNFVSNQIEFLKASLLSENLVQGTHNVDIILPSGKTANIKTRIYTDNAIDARPVSVTAIWPAKSKSGAPEQYISLVENNEHLETISVNTFLGTDEDLF